MKRIGTLLLIVGPLTTLAVTPFSSFDPINLIKMIVVSAIAFSVLLLLLTSWKAVLPRLPKKLWVALAFFVFWMTLVLLTSNAPTQQQFWGVFGRNNGYLAYISLLIILIAVALIQERLFYHKLVDALVLTAFPATIYALFQLGGRDPVSWSVMAPFATLGNVNFSSAFFGLASLASTVLVFSPGQKAYLRLLLIAMVSTDLFIIFKTGSIQGFMIYLAGLGVVGYFFIRSHAPHKFLRFGYLFVGVVAFVLTSLALNNIGPFARFVFGETILYRFDYWYAGWAMTMKSPLVGVGLDSYGDWYREVRGEIATLRTVPDRITNTAHNIYLDISSSGGIPLIVAYFVVIGFAFQASLRVIRRDKSFNPYFVALFATWVAYLIQAAISINQIGVGIWGWLFTGGLIGYEVATRDKASRLGQDRSRSHESQLPASVALLGISGFAIGFVLSFIPYNADARFKDALESGDVARQYSQAKVLGSTAFHMELVLDATIKSNDIVRATEITDELLRRYPRDFMAWRVKQALPSSTSEERQAAYQSLRQMDPFNPDIKPVE